MFSERTFSGSFRAFQTPQRLSEHYFIITDSLKHLPVCKYLKLWIYTREDASRQLSVFLWQKYRAGHILEGI